MFNDQTTFEFVINPIPWILDTWVCTEPAWFDEKAQKPSQNTNKYILDDFDTLIEAVVNDLFPEVCRVVVRKRHKQNNINFKHKNWLAMQNISPLKFNQAKRRLWRQKTYKGDMSVVFTTYSRIVHPFYYRNSARFATHIYIPGVPQDSTLGPLVLHKCVVFLWLVARILFPFPAMLPVWRV